MNFVFDENYELCASHHSVEIIQTIVLCLNLRNIAFILNVPIIANCPPVLTQLDRKCGFLGLVEWKAVQPAPGTNEKSDGFVTSSGASGGRSGV